jgi:hypothetical protein
MDEGSTDTINAIHVKEWWEGDGRGERLVDVALPHEDQEETNDAPIASTWTAGVATVVCVLTCIGAVASVVIATALDIL